MGPRAEPSRVLVLRTGAVDLDQGRIVRDGSTIALTALEARLLRYLVDHEGEDVSRDDLLGAVWGHVAATTSRAVDYTVFRLRAKLGEPEVPNHLLTVHGLGYRFVWAAEPVATVAPPRGQPTVEVPGGTLDPGRSRFVRRDGGVVVLSKLEVDVLGALIAANGRTVPRDAVIAAGWGRGSHDASLDALVRRLRVRLDDPDGAWIVTVRGRGLRLDTGAPARVRTDLGPLATPFEPRPELTRLLTSTDRLVTIRGTAGLGKTRLAVEAGLRWLADDPAVDVWFCDLSSANGPASLTREVARVLGVPRDETDPVEQIGRVLSRRGRTVLILDNFEQLVSHAPVVAQWLAAAPNTRVVATSREALGVAGEQVIDLAPLSADAGCRLFAERVHGAFDPTDPGVRAVVERLDGLPLAIELAAARAEDLGTLELLRRLEARLDLLVRRPERSTSHHPTLRGAFDASWELLAPAEKDAFARCAVFVSPFGRPAAHRVIGGDPATVDSLLDGLVARSLVHSGPEGRLRLLESLRDYALEKLVLLGARAPAEAAHRAYHLEVVAHAEAEASSPLEVLRPFRDELMVAFRRASAVEDRVRTAVALDQVLSADGPADLWLEVATAAGDGAARVPPALGWRALRGLADCERLQGRGDFGCERARTALALAREVDESAIGNAERQLGLCLRNLGRSAEAIEVLERALDRFRRLGHGRWEAATLSHIARVIYDVAGVDAAAPWFDQACRAFEAQSSTLSLSRLHDWWGGVLVELGEAPQAKRHLELADELARGDLSLAGMRFVRLADVARWHGDLAAADRLLTQAEAAFARNGSTEVEIARSNRATIAIERGDVAAALELLSSALALPMQAITQRALTAMNLAIVHHLLGRLDEALAGYERFLEHARQSAVRWIPIALGHWAMALADLDRPEAGAAVAEAREAALRGSVGVQVFVGLCEAVVALADARAGRRTWPDTIAFVHARIADSQVPTPAGGIPARCDPDVSQGMRILERALDATGSW